MTDPQATDRRALLQGAMQALDDMQAKLDRVEAAAREPIAIVGLSCRLPGGVDTPEAYWELLRDGRDVVGPFPDDRRALAASAGIDLDELADSAAWYGGFLEGLDQFDPSFFGISPREAVTMDPQQRLVLEVAWEALERAGIAPDGLGGSATGVFVGITANDYVQLAKLRGPAELDVYTATGGALNAAAGRLAYTLGLQGPAMAIDTACSSSLVAVHQACQSLRSGETDMAIAGGVNVILMPEAFVCFNRWGMMAPDGRCKTFDAAADGFVRSEGCGLLVLKRLSDAEAAGDPIMAVVRGSAVNQDGRSSGLTVPNGLAQEAVLRGALSAAGVAPADVQYVEAHGTGTTLGDPIEVEAIGRVLGERRRPDQQLVLGSVKTNLGHLESAAGIAGLIKVVLSMQHGEIPPHLHFHERSPDIPWPDFPVVVPTEPTSWPLVDGRRLAGVSGFGFSGTNAHVVLESAPQPDPAGVATSPTPDASPRVLPLSAKSEPALRELAGRFAAQLSAEPPLTLADACRTAALGRAQHPQRLAVVAADAAAAREQLLAVATGDHQLPGRAGRPRVAFLFTGQGAQYPGMAARLYLAEPVFREAFDRCAAIADPHLGRSLVELVVGSAADDPDGHPLHQTRVTQPALFAVEYALSELWASWGVVPHMVLGHSVGEYAAAVAAGVFSLEDGLTLLLERARLMQELPTGGAMTAVFASHADVAAAVEPHRQALAVAALNGALHTVVSGRADLVEQLTDEFAGRGVRVQRLTVSHAFHSPLMAPMIDEFRSAAERITYRAPKLPMVTNVTGAVGGAELTTPDYWVDQIGAPVQFAAALASLGDAGIDTFVELGPHPVLAGLGQADGIAGRWLPSLRRNRDDVTQARTSLAALWEAGQRVAWERLDAEVGRRVAAPTYPFQRQRFWIDPPRRREHAPAAGSHPLLGRATRSPLVDATIHQAVVDAEYPAWLSDHRLYGGVVFPGSAYLEMALAAGADGGPCSVTSLAIREPLLIADDAQVNVQTVVSGGDATSTVDILSEHPDGSGWTHHATATVQRGTAAHTPDPVDPTALADGSVAGNGDGSGEPIDVDAYYAHLESIGLDYGPTFRGLRRLVRGGRRAVGLAELPADSADAARYQLHPALLDACFHVIGVAIEAPSATDATGDVFVPVAVEGLRLHRAGASAIWCAAEILSGGAGDALVTVGLRLYDTDGEPVATIDRLDLRKAPRAALRQAGTHHDSLYEVAWRVREHDDSPAPSGTWLVLGDAAGVGEQLREQLVAAGDRCVLAVPAPSTTQVAPERWDVDIADREAVRRVVTECLAAGPLRGVVVLGALDAVPGADISAALEAVLGGALHAAQVLADGGDETRLWIVTRGAQSVEGEPASPVQAAAWGLARTIAAEQPRLRCSIVDADPAPGTDVPADLAGELRHADDEDQVAQRGGRRLVARLARHTPVEPLAGGGPYALTISERGALDNCAFVPAERRAPGAGEVEIEVRATGLNFRDVLNVLGMYPGDPGPPGLECAGVVVAVGDGVDALTVGDRVVAIAPQAFDAYVVTQAELAVPIPASLTFAEAATLPIAHLTAKYGLTQLAGLQPGERVLVHAAAGGVGMAAVQIAHRIGAEVYATVGSADKRRVVEALGVQHVYHSRTLDFAEQILADTGGAGVDVVLNSLSDEFIDKSFEVLAPTGRFLEIGKRGIWTADEVAERRPGVAYFPYDLADLLAAGASGVQALLGETVAEVAAGTATPLPLRAFPATSLTDALRFMAQARHIGKVVITHRPATRAGVDADGSYLVTGGLGGLGLALAGHLVERGARHLVLVGRRAPSPAAASAIDRWNAAGADVRVVAADVSDADGVARALAAADPAHPLRGVFHAAGVTDDAALAGQDLGRFRTVLGPKARGAALLSAATRALPLDHFVLFSSGSAVLGSPGQANYSAANAFLDGLANQRHAEGLPALSVDWGAWADVGMAAAMGARERERLADRGVGTISPAEGLAVLDVLIEGAAPQVAVLPIEWSSLLAHTSGDHPSPLLSEIALDVEHHAPRRGATAPARVSVRTALADAQPAARRGVLDAYVRDEIAHVLGLDPSHPIEPHQGLTDLGMDSLMAVELSNRLHAGTELNLPSTLAFEYPTFAELTEHLAASLIDGDGPAPGPAPVGAGDLAADDDGAVDDLSPDDLAAALMRELDDAGY